jgi:hypothetical protein
MIKFVLLGVLLLLVASPVRAQSPTPTPMRPAPKAAYDPNAPQLPPVSYQPRAEGWQRFQGAKSCEQVDRTLTCDNGYKQTLAR